ncbi:MAG: stage 0 sporulation family protein [Acutalibacteraceae bacterium]
MTEVISVKFKDGGRAYYFDPCGIKVKIGDSVIVETQNGTEFGTVSAENREVEDDMIVKPLRKTLRLATDRDFKRLDENRKKEAEAFKICEERIVSHKLDMKLVSVEYSFDSNKIVFFFTSDGRVDFRELVKDLASRFHTRIELRQIGVRDEAKLLGGLGICGQPYCCKRFLSDFQPVSIKMAKEQGLSLNPTKISGSCGRLMCCLNYEQDAYEYLNSFTPNVGATVKTAEGLATVTDVNLITGNLFVKLIDSDTIPFKVHRDDVKLVSRTKKRHKDGKNDDEQ